MWLRVWRSVAATLAGFVRFLSAGVFLGALYALLFEPQLLGAFVQALADVPSNANAAVGLQRLSQTVVLFAGLAYMSVSFCGALLTGSGSFEPAQDAMRRMVARIVAARDPAHIDIVAGDRFMSGDRLS
jgi:hypothetical protein